MAASNNERVGKALDLLHAGLRPFVERELRAVYKGGWTDQVGGTATGHGPAGYGGGGFGGRTTSVGGEPHFDAQALLNVMWDQWHAVFANKLGHAERSLVSELRTIRNRWAHQEAFNTDDTYRALDSVSRLLTAVSAPEASDVDHQKQELLRMRYEEQARRETRKAAVAPVEGKPQAGLPPWRGVVAPHPDVASGRYQQAEFAADLSQVQRGEGSSEYLDPREFFQRTYLTEGMRHLLGTALERLAGRGGDPVVELQTNFGGGKTHSMLALYHLFSGVPATSLPGVDPVLAAAGVAQPPDARRAVLVGTALSPGQPHRKPDGTLVHTLWGELAWQIGGQDGYDLVAEADRQGVSPGSLALRDLFAAFSPCLILIDEWVTFVRQLYNVDGLPAGSFDANLSFAQALTEAARQAPATIVVASIPSSDIEIGGEGGKIALERLRHTFGRMESAWRPASAEEGFEIVRRRLFQPMTDPKAAVARDAVARAFAELYRAQASEFPAACREASYEQRIQAAYPIHPELFDRLYNDWSSLDRFQRTRGVLRLMAVVIHTLWERQDTGLLILPASVPVGDLTVQSELTRYMEDPWVPVIEKDIDGPNSLPLQLDRDHVNLGRYSACRRVARTLYIGSAPTLHTSRRGLDDRSIKLGCAQPGEIIATFGDALRRLSDEATHLYVNANRYWFATQPSVIRVAQERAERIAIEDVHLELIERLRKGQKSRGEFVRIHIAPTDSADVPDDPETRLVILAPRYEHVRDTESMARQAAATMLDRRGSSPRRYRNVLVFLAPDRTRLRELEDAGRQFLAWKSIEDETRILNLDAFAADQAVTKRKQADDTVQQRIPETYHWLLVPAQKPQEAVTWDAVRFQPDADLVRSASRKLMSEEYLITDYAATILRTEIDRIPLWRGDHVGIKQLWDDFAQYPYLPRLKERDVLLRAIQSGLNRLTWESETFAYAEGWDEKESRYTGLRAGDAGSVATQSGNLLVKPEAARRQLDAEAAARREREQALGFRRDDRSPGATSAGASARATGAGAPCVADGGGDYHAGTSDTKPSTGEGPLPPVALAHVGPRRFYGRMSLDPLRSSRDASAIASEVLQHLTSLLHANVEVTIEIQAQLPEGTPDHVVRTVTENCRTLKFSTAEFEAE